MDKHLNKTPRIKMYTKWKVCFVPDVLPKSSGLYMVYQEQNLQHFYVWDFDHNKTYRSLIVIL